MKKDVRINVKLIKEERNKFHEICKKEETTISIKIREYIKNLIKNAVE